MKENLLTFTPSNVGKYQARYIRLDNFKINGYPIINELQVLTTDNTNLSILPNTVASASSYHLTTTQAFHAIDNDLDSLWHKNTSDSNPWFQLDMGSVVFFDKLKTYTVDAGAMYFFTGCDIKLGSSVESLVLVKQLTNRVYTDGWNIILD